MTDEYVLRAHVAEALKRLEDEQCYGYPEFWDWLAEIELGAQ